MQVILAVVVISPSKQVDLLLDDDAVVASSGSEASLTDGRHLHPPANLQVGEVLRTVLSQHLVALPSQQVTRAGYRGHRILHEVPSNHLLVEVALVRSAYVAL